MRLLRTLAVPNLTIYLIVLSGAVSAYAIQFHSAVGLLGPHVTEGEWWHLLFFPFRIADGWISLLFHLYGLWLFGVPLEHELDTERYNAYVFLGLLATLGGAVFLLLTPGLGLGAASISSVYLYYSIFFGAAFLAPNMELLLFFILPVRIKWLALILAGTMVVSAGQAAMAISSPWPFLGPVLGTVNFFVFFGKDLWRAIVGSSTKTQREFRSAAPAAAASSHGNRAFHRCVICGLTELEDAAMDFRFCVDCADHEYCSKHLSDHQHIRG